MHRIDAFCRSAETDTDFSYLAMFCCSIFYLNAINLLHRLTSLNLDPINCLYQEGPTRRLTTTLPGLLIGRLSWTRISLELFKKLVCMIRVSQYPVSFLLEY